MVVVTSVCVVTVVAASVCVVTVVVASTAPTALVPPHAAKAKQREAQTTIAIVKKTLFILTSISSLRSVTNSDETDVGVWRGDSTRSPFIRMPVVQTRFTKGIFRRPP
jgi:hypothetical protein